MILTCKGPSRTHCSLWAGDPSEADSVNHTNIILGIIFIFLKGIGNKFLFLKAVNFFFLNQDCFMLEKQKYIDIINKYKKEKLYLCNCDTKDI